MVKNIEDCINKLTIVIEKLKKEDKYGAEVILLQEVHKALSMPKAIESFFAEHTCYKETVVQKANEIRDLTRKLEEKLK